MSQYDLMFVGHCDLYFMVLNLENYAVAEYHTSG